MDKKVRNTIALVFTVMIVVTVQQGILYTVDKGIGAGNVQVITQDAEGNEQWTMGLIPNLETAAKDDAISQGQKIWASPGDYSGDAIMGITAAIASVMWIVWLGVFLGFPGSTELRKERLLGLAVIALLVVVLNLLFLRSISDATTSGSVVKNTTGHLSLAICNTGILLAILFHRMGVGVKDPSVPMMPALGATRIDNAHRDFYKKLYGVVLILLIAGALEVAFQLANAAIPEVAVDASVWLIWGVIFIGHFGTFPSDWRMGKRPIGIALMLMLTLATLAGFYVLQIVTDESIGSGIMESRLSSAGLSENAGLSLMLSCWLVFWTIAVGAAGYCDPSVVKVNQNTA